MFRIGEFSRLAQVTIKALRFYDEEGLLEAASVDPLSGYRYYSASQLARLNRILALKGLGLSLEEIRRLLGEGVTPGRIKKLLRRKREEIQGRIAEEAALLARVEARLDLIEREGKMSKYEVTLKPLQEVSALCMRDVIAQYSAVGGLFGRAFAALGKQGVAPAGPAMAIYYDPEYKEKDVDVEVAIPIAGPAKGIDGAKARKIESAEAAVTIHQGPYEKIGEAYASVMSWLEPNGYVVAGPVREVYLTDPSQTPDPADYVTEVQVPVRKV